MDLESLSRSDVQFIPAPPSAHSSNGQSSQTIHLDVVGSSPTARAADETRLCQDL
jgi:hypothetical protein